MTKTIAIIPARGGSKRIKNKNIKIFLGKPMIAWTIISAKKSGIFDRILVSTESKKIAQVAKKYGAEVPFLRNQYYDDITPVSKATIHSLKEATKYWNEKYDTVIQLMANCPLREAGDIKRSYKNFKKNRRNFQISCFKFGWMNPWWSFLSGKNNKIKPIFPKQIKKRSQDLPNLYCPSGAIWIAKVNKLFESKSFYGKNACIEEINWINAVDIDDEEDLKFAEVLKKFRNKK